MMELTQEASFLSLAQVGHGEYEEKKSRFLAFAAPIASEEQALSYLKEIRTKYSDARHNVYAYLLSSPSLTRYSDDGEPQGTAGLPLLELLRKRGITGAFLAVTRYFGGTLLGASGLLRAYTLSGAAALDAAGVRLWQPYQALSLTCPYPLFRRIERELATFHIKCDRVDFDSEVHLHLALPDTYLSAFLARITELGAGSITPVLTERRFDFE